MKNEILLINQSNIENAGCVDAAMALDVTEKAILSYANGNILFPDKISQIFDEQTQDRINCLPATLVKEKVCGVKWVSVFPSNAFKGIQNLSAVIILSGTETGFTKAFMEATVCSNLRTAAVSAVAAKHLSVANPTRIGFVGAGQQARYHFLLLKHLFPQISHCYVASRTAKSEREFIDEFMLKYPDMTFVPCGGNYELSVRNSDILISAISGQSPIIKSEWIDKGMLYLHIGGWEDEYEVPLKADKIVCDNWESVKHRTQTLSRLYQMNKISDEDIYCDIDELVSGKIPGRTSPDEFIYFNAVGLSYVDIALANEIYNVCKQCGEGTCFTLHN